jgi:spore germination cell wall hydrolase CwlJ-like protein
MTSLAINRRRIALALAGFRIEAIAFAFVILASAAAMLLAFRSPAQATDESATVQLTPTKAAALVAATSASPADLRAVGERAQMLNAALPFSTLPVQAAHPFAIGTGNETDHRRALLCLTQAVYYEAGFEPLAGRRAVAQVVLNRMRHPAFPKSVCGVVYQVARAPVCQFSFVCDGSLNRAPAPGPWREAKAVAEAALAGFVETSVGSATHYHANYVSPRWAPMLTKITQLGAHIFYRWPGAWGQRAAFSGRYIGEPREPSSLRPPEWRPGNAAPTPTTTEQAVALAEAVDAGPPIARAPTDVGGLLDTSKGWKLNIPSPDEVGSATARALAAQRAKAPEPAPAATAAAAAPVVASR